MDVKIINVIVALVCLFQCTRVHGSIDLAAGIVFNAAFYMNNNPSVISQGIENPPEAKDHWLKVGLAQGLQACGNFHTKQYLQKYPDLAKKFQGNYTAAAAHFITSGKSQGLMGVVDGGYEGRYTIYDTPRRLYISASERMGGAVDSIVYDNIEFINAYDHGREIGLAVTAPPYGECWNPREAGGRDDKFNGDTTSDIVSMSSDSSNLKSVTYPAFWLRPGDTETGDSGSKCQTGSPALNTNSVYQYTFGKTISIGCEGAGDDPCFTYSAQVSLGGAVPKDFEYFQIEGPTAYHVGEFNTTRSVDISSGNLLPFDGSKPLVFSSWCLQHAFGVWIPPNQKALDDGRPTFFVEHLLAGQTFADASQKWSLVWRKNAASSDLPQVFDFKINLCVGTEVEAAKCVFKLAQYYLNK